MKSNCGSFLNFTNNRLESINGKFKQVTAHLKSSLTVFFIILTALRTERDHKAALMLQKVKVIPFSEDSPECQYSNLLTTYAADYVLKQMKMTEKVQDITEKDDHFTVKTSEGLKVVSLTSCECIFHSSMRLLCRHIFALREKFANHCFLLTCVIHGGRLHTTGLHREFFLFILHSLQLR